MSIIKKTLIILIILTMCIPLINTVTFAYSVELETEGLISFPMFIMGGSGTVTIKDTIKDYKLYFQAIPVSDEIYLELQNNEPSQNEELKALKEEYENLKKELDELKDKKDEYDKKNIEYMNKLTEYNSKIKELQEKKKELTPTYDEKDWKELTDNKFQIDLTQFEGNVAHAVWIKLVTADNKTYYDEATYELSGTKKTTPTPNPTPSSEQVKEIEKINTKLYVVKDQSETKYLENDQGYITKKIVDSNPDTGEVTVELKLSNRAKEVEKTKDTEIFLVVDNSGSMGYTTSTGEIRRDIIVRAMKKLVNNIYDNSSNVKVGLVRFAETGNLLTDSTALMSNLTDNKQTLLNKIEEFENLDTSVTVNGKEMLHCEGGTNIEAGIKKANDNFSSEDKNKIIILLTDGIPTSAISSKYSNDLIYNETKSRLKLIGDSGVSVISLMTGVTNDDNEGNINSAQVVEQIFGTESNPTTGKFYNIVDTNLEKVVTNDILADVMEKVQNPINNTKIVDYFPEDITDNFDFSYIGTPSVGTTSDAIETESKNITWDIGTLKGDEEATLKYKLKIKDMLNTELLNKTIATNEKVVLTYKDMKDNDYTVTLSSSPQIELSEVKENEKSNDGQDDTKSNDGQTYTKDPTVAPNKILPNTGLSVALIGSILLVIVGGVAVLAKYHKLRDVK